MNAATRSPIPVNTVQATDPTKAPTIISPTDPTHSPAAVPTAFTVIGQGTAGDVHIADQGMFPNTFTNITPASDGSFTGSITLSPGTPAEPLRGWHKLRVRSGRPGQPCRCSSSVGIDPPTVEFPRNGAELSCDDSDQTEPPVAIGTLAYPVDELGPLCVFEETGRDGLGDVGAKIGPLPPLQPGGLPRFNAFFGNLGPGRHVLLFFQAPAGAAGHELDAHLRAFSSLADTPTSRIVVDAAAALPDPARICRQRGACRIITPPFRDRILPQRHARCDRTAPAIRAARCQVADVNVRVGERVYTTRADAHGTWNAHRAAAARAGARSTFAQVVDSKVGGAWSESCPSNELELGVQPAGRPDHHAAAPTSPSTPPARRARWSSIRTSQAVNARRRCRCRSTCVPASGSTFPIGATPVLCTATDPANRRGRRSAEFVVTVIDGAADGPGVRRRPSRRPAGGARAGQLSDRRVRRGRPGPAAVDCVPSAPNLFLLDEVTTVMCDVTDSGPDARARRSP